VLIYVDGALIVDNNPDLRNNFVTDLGRRFPVEDKGELNWILNVFVTRNRQKRTLSLSQELYIDDLLTKCDGFIDSSTTRRFDSPLEEASTLSPDLSPTLGSDEHIALAPQRQMYMSVVGGLLWLANMTRPDIAFAATTLARVLTNPGTPHIRAAVRVLLYLRGTKQRVLTFATQPDRLLDVYVDSDWAIKFSCSGVMCFLYGCLFHWFSKMQRSVSLSSAEAEYFGAMLCARDVVFIRDLLSDLGFELSSPTPIYSDSKSAIDMSFDPVAFKKTKHILRAAEFLRDLVAREVVVLRHMSGKLMLADILTKAVARVTFLKLIGLLDNYTPPPPQASPLRPVGHMVTTRPTGRPRILTSFAAVPMRFPLATARQFGPLNEGAIGFCQCPYAPHGCRNEMYEMDNTIYCDYCFFESNVLDNVPRACHCDCVGCEPPVAPCVRDDCPCTASRDGRSHSFCSSTCADGRPCSMPVHTYPLLWPRASPMPQADVYPADPSPG
jgi:hypothetical protein